MSDFVPISKCIICFSGILPNAVVVLKKCGHTFHETCVNKWIQKTKVCPTCRAKTSAADVLKLFFDTVSADDSFALTQPNNDDFVKHLNENIEKLKSEKAELLKVNRSQADIIRDSNKVVTNLKLKAARNEEVVQQNRQLERRLVDQDALQQSLKRVEQKLKACEFYNLIKAGDIGESAWRKYVDDKGEVRTAGFEQLMTTQYKTLREKYNRQQTENEKLKKQLLEEGKKLAAMKKIMADSKNYQGRIIQRVSPPRTTNEPCVTPKRKSLGFNFDSPERLVDNPVEIPSKRFAGATTVRNAVPIQKKRSARFTFDDEDENVADVSLIVPSNQLFGGVRKPKPFTTNLNDRFHRNTMIKKPTFSHPALDVPKPQYCLPHDDDSVIILS